MHVTKKTLALELQLPFKIDPVTKPVGLTQFQDVQRDYVLFVGVAGGTERVMSWIIIAHGTFITQDPWIPKQTC